MILRRPYAFLIKHFRLIHLILFMLFVYITYKANGMLSFFNEYIVYNGNMEIISSNYISYYMFVAVFFIVVISIVIYFLMRYKKKPKLLYVLLVLVSVLSLIAFIYLYSNIKILETTIFSGREIRLFRDISRVNYWVLFISCIPLLIRGLGFDIKKFNFSSDLKELNLKDEDREEVYVNVEVNADTLKRTGRKWSRELGYYYKENRLIINIILVIVGLVVLFIFPFNKYVINRDLNEGEILGTSNFNIRINESYISDRNRISKNNSYVILKVDVIGKTNKYILDLDEFVLEGKNNKYVPSLKYYYYFSDLGIGYRNNVLNTSAYKEYLFIYNIKNEDRDSEFIFKYIDSDRKIRINLKEIK